MSHLPAVQVVQLLAPDPEYVPNSYEQAQVHMKFAVNKSLCLHLLNMSYMNQTQRGHMFLCNIQMDSNYTIQYTSATYCTR